MQWTKRRCLFKRYFRCPVCGAETPAPCTRRKTLPGHIKTMYCYVCRETRDFEQVE